jgi:hypothetical protein
MGEVGSVEAFFRAVVLTAIAAAWLSASGGSSGAGSDGLDTSKDYVADKRAQLSLITVSLPDPSLAKPQLNAVTDIRLLFSPKRGNAAPSRNGTPQAEFAARVYAVASGRVCAGPPARCGTFTEGIAQCSLDCEGGGFALRQGGGSDLELLVGTVPGGSAGEDAARGILISPCDFEGGAEAYLAPKSGHGLAVIGLKSE